MRSAASPSLLHFEIDRHQVRFGVATQGRSRRALRLSAWLCEDQLVVYHSTVPGHSSSLVTSWWRDAGNCRRPQGLGLHQHTAHRCSVNLVTCKRPNPRLRYRRRGGRTAAAAARRHLLSGARQAYGLQRDSVPPQQLVRHGAGADGQGRTLSASDPIQLVHFLVP